MILINVKFPVRDDKLDEWMDVARRYRDAVNDEPGNAYFEWSRELDAPNTFVTIEVFADAHAGASHTETDHFTAFVEAAPDLVSGQPEIIYVDSDDIDGWGPMGEIEPRSSS